MTTNEWIAAINSFPAEVRPILGRIIWWDICSDDKTSTPLFKEWIDSTLPDPSDEVIVAAFVELGFTEDWAVKRIAGERPEPTSKIITNKKINGDPYYNLWSAVLLDAVQSYRELRIMGAITPTNEVDSRFWFSKGKTKIRKEDSLSTNRVRGYNLDDAVSLVEFMQGEIFDGMCIMLEIDPICARHALKIRKCEEVEA